MKTLNRQLRDAMRPVRKELRETPKRVLTARIREAEADDWIGFVNRERVIPLKRK